MASLCKLELLAPMDRPLSEIVGELPESPVVHRQVRCPWARKGAVMRILTERTKGMEVDVTDGSRSTTSAAGQVLPDPDEPLVHIFAEGKTPEDSASLEAEFQDLVEEIVAREDEAEEPEPARGAKPSSRG